jgi:transposase-like protein
VTTLNRICNWARCQMRRAWFSGGSRNGEQVLFESEPPAFLIVDGERYELFRGGQMRAYRIFPRRKWTRVTERHLRLVLAHVDSGETISRACKLAGVSSAAVYRHRRNHSGFRQALDEAKRGRARSSQQGRPLTDAALSSSDEETS